MKKVLFTGSGVAVATPFKKGGDGVDYQSLGRHLDFLIENGTQAIVTCGTTGESATLPDDEHKEIIHFTLGHVGGRVPVIAGTGSNYTAHAVEFSRFAEKEGADGVLVVTPYYNKTTQAGLAAHYLHIADSMSLPVIVYNVPSRTGLNILPETYAKLAEHENINAIKEANSDIAALARTCALTDGKINIYSGNDDEIVPILSLGGVGVISVLGNICPRETQDICRLFFEGKIAESAKLQCDVLELVGALFCETNPIPVKYALSLMGFGNGEVRLPLIEMQDKRRMEEAMRRVGIKF